jgi:transposase
MRTPRRTAELPFGTMKMRMGATRFLTKTLPQGRHRDGAVRPHHNLTRVLNIVGVPALLEALKG